MNNETLLLRLGGVVGLIQEKTDDDTVVKAVKAIMSEVEEGQKES